MIVGNICIMHALMCNILTIIPVCVVQLVLDAEVALQHLYEAYTSCSIQGPIRYL